jgi:hypothetical protein
LYGEIQKNAIAPSNARLRSQSLHTNLLREPYYKHIFGLSTFEYFSAKFINIFFINVPCILKAFKVYLTDNLTNFYLKFCEISTKFNLQSKTFFVKKLLFY